jgi:hypothetical protein
MLVSGQALIKALRHQEGRAKADKMVARSAPNDALAIAESLDAVMGPALDGQLMWLSSDK